MLPFQPMVSQNETASTTASSPIVLSKWPHVLFIGEGTQTVYVKFGGPDVVATNEDIPILSGMALLFNRPDGTEYISILAGASTSRLGIVQGRYGT